MSKRAVIVITVAVAALVGFVGVRAHEVQRKAALRAEQESSAASESRKRVAAIERAEREKASGGAPSRMAPPVGDSPGWRDNDGKIRFDRVPPPQKRQADDL